MKTDIDKIAQSIITGLDRLNNTTSTTVKISQNYNRIRKEIILEHLRHISAHAVDAESRCVHPNGYIKSVRICGLCGEQM